MDFPASPTIGQQHPVVDPKWEWDGTVWTRLPDPTTISVINDPLWWMR